MNLDLLAQDLKKIFGGALPEELALREGALAKALALGWPSRKNESWKYTSLQALKSQGFKGIGTHVEASAFLKSVHTNYSARIVFNSGFVDAENSDFGNQVRIQKWSELSESEKKSLLVPDSGFIGSLNAAFLSDAVLIKVPAASIITHPIQIIRLTGTEAEGTQENTKVVVICEKGSEVVLEMIGAGYGSYLRNEIDFFNLAESSQLRILRMDDNPSGGFTIAEARFVLQRGAKLVHSHVALGTTLNRRSIDVRLEGEGAEAKLNGLSLLGQAEVVDNQINVEHTAPRCTSRQLYKSVLTDRARGIFNGRVFIPKHSIGTDADQLNKNLLLSSKAEVDTKPQLEVFADDVKASHGAAIGRLNEDELFYLQSRGIPKAESAMILSRAFIDEILLQIENSDSQTLAKQRIYERFQSMKVTP